VWVDPVDAQDANEIMFRLKRKLYNVLSNWGNHNGLIDYVKARDDPGYPIFEEAACELQSE
jgi:hypothetical protein